VHPEQLGSAALIAAAALERLADPLDLLALQELCQRDTADFRFRRMRRRRRSVRSQRTGQAQHIPARHDQCALDQEPRSALYIGETEKQIVLGWNGAAFAPVQLLEDEVLYTFF